MTTADFAATVQPIADHAAGRTVELAAADRLPADLVAACRTAGVYRAGLPIELGGISVPLPEWIDAMLRLAEGDGSLGWCAVVAGVGASLLARLPEVEAREVASDPDDLLIAGGFAPKGRAVRDGDSLRVTGQWSLASGCFDASWYLAGFMTDRGPGVTFVPATAGRVVEDWDPIGLRATGSHSIALDAVQVPADRVALLAGGPRWSDDPLAAIPFFALAPLLGAVPLGIAGRALAELVTTASARTPMGQESVLADNPLFQDEYARVRGRWQAARTALIDAGGNLWQHAVAGEVPSEVQAWGTLSAQAAAEAADEVVRFAHRAAGTAALRADHVLTRCLVDATVASRHIVFGPFHRQGAARTLLGRS